MKKRDYTVDICPISPADIFEVKSLEQESNLAPWSLDDYFFEAARADSVALAAKIENRVAGFLIARLIRNPPSNSNNSCEIEIYNICVASRYRKNGIGRALIREMIRGRKEKTTSIWLEVRRSNDKARSFYKALGFETVGSRKNFYRNPTEDGLIMRKSF